MEYKAVHFGNGTGITSGDSEKADLAGSPRLNLLGPVLTATGECSPREQLREGCQVDFAKLLIRERDKRVVHEICVSAP